jgi:hypothetical protein
MLSSILKQSYPNLIVHISDNAWDDSALEIIDAFNMENIGS